MMAQLIGIDDGDWIDPAEVVRVRIRQVGVHKLFITLRGGTDVFVRTFEDLDIAVRAKDDLAARINAARLENPGGWE